MKKLTNLFPSLSLFFLLVLLVTSSCVDQDFDAPPTTGEDPDIPASAILSIQDLKEQHIFGTITQIESDQYISGVVTANDESGNLFQTIVIADETAGIFLLIEQTGLFTKYPVGRRIFVKLDGLYLSVEKWTEWMELRMSWKTSLFNEDNLALQWFQQP